MDVLKIAGRALTAGTLIAAIGMPTVAVGAGSLPGNKEGRMTGGGSVMHPRRAFRVTHGFELRCKDASGPNRLQVNWRDEKGVAHRFHLERLPRETIRCTNAAQYEEGKPEAGFDTYRGIGTGRLDGAGGARVDFKFGDGGERGTADVARIIIHNAAGVRVLNLNSAQPLRFGNHQAHRR